VIVHAFSPDAHLQSVADLLGVGNANHVETGRVGEEPHGPGTLGAFSESVGYPGVAFSDMAYYAMLCCQGCKAGKSVEVYICYGMERGSAHANNVGSHGGGRQPRQPLGYENVAFMGDDVTAWSALRWPVIGEPL